jgi:hypothetical protein
MGMEESRLFYRRKVKGITFMWLAPFYYAIDGRCFALAYVIVSIQIFLCQSPFAHGGKVTKPPSRGIPPRYPLAG